MASSTEQQASHQHRHDVSGWWSRNNFNNWRDVPVKITLKYEGVSHLIHENPCTELMPWLPDPSEMPVVITPKVETGPRAPRPRYGWHGQPDSYCKFPIGTKVWIGESRFNMMGEVLELGNPPASIRMMTDLVHLRLLTDASTSGYSVGHEDWWSEYQLTEVE